MAKPAGIESESAFYHVMNQLSGGFGIKGNALIHPYMEKRRGME